jgi:hypothetical protein
MHASFQVFRIQGLGSGCMHASFQVFRIQGLGLGCMHASFSGVYCGGRGGVRFKFRFRFGVAFRFYCGRR